MNVPLLDLVAQYRGIKDDVLRAMMTVIERQGFIMGPEVGQLENEVAALCQAKYAIACASGTDALLLPLKALDMKPGDEVIAPAFTFFATAGAIHNAGGTPVFAGTRVPVRTLIEYLEAGHPLDQFLDDFPSVTREHAVAVLEIAKQALVTPAA